MSSSHVATGKPKVAGSVYKAPAGTTLPTDATSTLASAFVSMGYISEDGVRNTISSESANIKDWGGTTVYTLETSREDTFTMTFIESLNPDVLKAVHGDSNVTGSALNSGVSVTVDSDELAACVWVVDMIMRGNTVKRIVIPNGKITDVGEVTYKKDEAIGYEVTITAAADSSGNLHYEYIKDTTTTSG